MKKNYRVILFVFLTMLIEQISASIPFVKSIKLQESEHGFKFAGYDRIFDVSSSSSDENDYHENDMQGSLVKDLDRWEQQEDLGIKRYPFDAWKNDLQVRAMSKNDKGHISDYESDDASDGRSVDSEITHAMIYPCMMQQPLLYDNSSDED